MGNRFVDSDGLCDDLIVDTLLKSVDDYKNGEVMEVYDVLQEICRAIKTFDRRCVKAGTCV